MTHYTLFYADSGTGGGYVDLLLNMHVGKRVNIRVLLSFSVMSRCTEFIRQSVVGPQGRWCDEEHGEFMWP